MKYRSILKTLLTAFVASLFFGCDSAPDKINKSFEILDDEAYNIFSTSAQIEVLDSGFTWTEGPLWLDKTNQLLFNDIPSNKTYSWSENDGTKVYLDPSGYTSDIPRTGESGANGMLLDNKGQLVLCQHGDRRMATMNSPIDNPASNFKTLVSEYQGNRFSSPNDATYSKAGNLYFTDPPYGLPHPDQQETSFNGVYRYSKDGVLTVIDSTLTRPNGIAFSPDEKTLYVANSDPNNASWTAYAIDCNSGTYSFKKIFFDATENAKTEKGLPDGLKVNDEGYIFASGPGGIWIFNPKGKAIAKIKTGQATSNCAFGPSQDILYMTADDYLMRATFR